LRHFENVVIPHFTQTSKDKSVCR